MIGGIQFSASFVRRCLPRCSCEESQRDALTVDAGAVSGELYRVATRIASEHTAINTTTAHQRAHRPFRLLVRLSISPVSCWFASNISIRKDGSKRTHGNQGTPPATGLDTCPTNVVVCRPSPSDSFADYLCESPSRPPRGKDLHSSKVAVQSLLPWRLRTISAVPRQTVACGVFAVVGAQALIFVH